MVVQMLLFLFLRVLLIGSWRDCLYLLHYSVIKTKSWEHRSITVKIYKHRLQQPHSQRNIYCKMKEEITSQKKTIYSQKKCDSEGQETFAFTLFY